MNVEIKKGTMKMAVGNYVIYDRNYLLDNLSREIYLLATNKQRTVKKFSKEDFERFVDEQKTD